MGLSALETGVRKEARTQFGLLEIWSELGPGASLSRAGLLLHHLKQAFSGMITSPLTTALTVLTCAVALALFGALAMFVQNSAAFLSASGASLTASVFLKDDLSQSQVAEVQKDLRVFEGVRSVVHRTKAQALAEFAKSLGDQAALLKGLESDNPLPASFEVAFVEGADSLFEPFHSKFSAHPAVELVQYNRGLVEQVGILVRSLKLAGWFAVAMVFGAVAFIISNTIRLSLHSQREEIEIMRLVGATDRFVRAPYLLAGLLQGLLGAGFSLALVYLLHAFLVKQALASPVFQTLLPNLTFLSAWWGAAVLAAGGLIGFAGSYLAVRKFRYM